MASLNLDGSTKDVNMMEAKSEDSEQYTSEDKDNSIVKRYKLKASSPQKQMRYICKECGKQMTTQSNLNAHKRSAHEGIKYPCRQCQHQATSRGSLAQHIRAVHDGIKYPCGQCQHQATSKGGLSRHRRAIHEQINKVPLI